MSPAREHPAMSRLALEVPAEHRVAALSASLLRAVMITYDETNEQFAARAGVAAEVVAEALSGTCPAWALPYDDFTAIGDAAEAMWPSPVFETATACDLLLSCVLNGDQVMATDVLADPCTQDLARALLRLAIAGEAQDSLLPQDVLTFLADQAARLADAGSPDAWVGVELLVACPRRQS
jgi:hypothetical protein